MVIRRILNALRRGLADRNPPRQFRPNELSRETVRADRLRRDARQAATDRRPVAPAVDEQPRRERQPIETAPQARPAPLALSLKSRSEVRRAMLWKEILGPPAALRWPRDGDPEVLKARDAGHK